MGTTFLHLLPEAFERQLTRTICLPRCVGMVADSLVDPLHACLTGYWYWYRDGDVDLLAGARALKKPLGCQPVTDRQARFLPISRAWPGH